MQCMENEHGILFEQIVLHLVGVLPIFYPNSAQSTRT